MSEDILKCTITDVRPMANMLRSLSFRPTGMVEILDEGIKVTVEEGRSIQANAYLKRQTFNHFEYNPPPQPASTPIQDDDGLDLPPEELRCMFGISLTTLLECLNIFGNAGGGLGPGGYGQDEGAKADGGGTTSLTMTYAGEGEPLILLLGEGGIVTRCEMTTYDPDDLMELAFEDEFKVQKMIMKSGPLRDALSEIDPTSERLSISFLPSDYSTGHPDPTSDAPAIDEPNFRLEAIGTLGSTEMDYPFTRDREVLEVYECNYPIRNTYKFSHIQLTQRALAASTKTSIRTAEDGLISFQYMIPLAAPLRSFGGEKKTSNDLSGFVEFLCVPLEEEVG